MTVRWAVFGESAEQRRRRRQRRNRLDWLVDMVERHNLHEGSAWPSPPDLVELARDLEVPGVWFGMSGGMLHERLMDATGRCLLSLVSAE